MKHIGELLEKTMAEILLKERRFKALVFNCAFEAMWLQKALEKFPEGTYICGAERDVYTATSMIMIASPDFAKVPEAQQMPRLIVEIDSMNKEVNLLEEKPFEPQHRYEEYNPSFERSLNRKRRLFKGKEE